MYAAMVDVMDQGIGLVTESLEQTGLRDNTLVFFISDNGGPQPMSWSENFWNGSSNATLRGGKVNLYEGGVRVPFVASWPARLPAGTKYDAPVSAIDISRTAVACAGGDASAVPAMEGVDLIPYLTGETIGPPNPSLYWRGKDGARWAVTNSTGDKYVKDELKGDPKLFDLKADLAEKNDRLGQSPEVASALRDRWLEWDKKNVAGRIGNYLEYHKRRDRFYLDSLPERAKEAGYPPREQ